MIEQALTEVASELEGDELVICLLSEKQWKRLNLNIQQADMLVEETKHSMDVSVRLLQTNHLLITIRSVVVTNDFAEETLRVFLGLLGLTSLTELVRIDPDYEE